jgi:hypothetical protein
VFCREPNGLKLLMKLYVERSHSLWKEPEVVLAVIMHAQDSEIVLYQNWVMKNINIFSGYCFVYALSWWWFRILFAPS